MVASELPPKETGKTRSQRIQLDYHRARGWLYWSRWLLALPVLLVSLLYGGAVVTSALSPSNEKQTAGSWATHVSTGELSAAHAHFAQDCNQCHDDRWSTAISANAPQRLFGLQAGRDVAAIEAKCQTCHEVGRHTTNSASQACQVADRTCAACHHEHAGAEQDLRRVTNAACVGCHTNLSMVCGSHGELLNAINDFSVASHAVAAPNSGPSTFRSLQSDRGRIKFDHDQHLQAGQVDLGNRRGGFSREHLTERWQSRYQSNAEGLIELQCQDCHQLEAGQTGYQPIDYEQHCAACHQLTFTGQSAQDLPLPHGAPRQELRTLLAAKLNGSTVSGKISTYSSLAEGAGKNLATAFTQLRLEEAVDATFALCTQCHLDEDLSDAVIDARLADPKRDGMIPSQWLQHASFNHQSHTRVDCQYCHDVNASTAESAPQDHRRVMIAGPESCVGCHREGSLVPPGTKSQFSRLSHPPTQVDFNREGLPGISPLDSPNTRQPNRVQSDCTLCHTYHP